MSRPPRRPAPAPRPGAALVATTSPRTALAPRTVSGHAASAARQSSRARGARVSGMVALALTGAAALAGCAGTVALEPAAEATDPACAEVIVRLPDTVGDAPRRETDAQATGAWGDPAAVLLRCGVEPYGPTTLPCYNVNGVDWIRDDTDDPTFVFTTYGRTPAVEVVVDSNAASGTSALVDLTTAVSAIPQQQICLDADDVLDTGITPTPTP